MRLAARVGLALAAVLGANVAGLTATASAKHSKLLFGLPVRCEIGRDCFIQQYVDRDPRSGSAFDYRCGPATYDTHKGLDIRVPHTRDVAADVPVVAAAPGIVIGIRDGMADRLQFGPQAKRAVAGRECGNGVTLRHANGWETQYCHLKSGSVTVRRGDRIGSETVLGAIGYSGAAQFPHVHFAVRHRGRVVDPFRPGRSQTSCNQGPVTTGTPETQTLWRPAALAQLTYRSAEIIAVHFADRPIKSVNAQPGPYEKPHARAPVLAALVRVIKVLEGDRTRLTIHGPGGVVTSHTTKPSPRYRAHSYAFAGRRLRAARWPRGRYRAVAEVLRGDRVVSERTAELIID